jgi:hypothetical protein
MALKDLIFHLANFVTPALVVAILLALAGPLIIKKSPVALGFVAQAAINMIVGGVVLWLGLWILGADGKMTTYAVLLVALATGQWLGSRGWR